MGLISKTFFKIFPCLKPKDVRKIPLPLIYLYDDKKNKKFPGNKVSTTKYSIISFLPLFLYNQFKHVTNIYFLLVAIISLIPQISATNPITNVLPLVFVLCVSGIKEIIEDIRRWIADRGFNNAKYTRVNVSDGNLTSITSAEVRTGYVLELKTNDRIPADCIPLSSSNDDGIVFVQTAALDGETNLKEVFVPKDLNSIDTLKMIGTMHCNPPNEYFNQYNATIKLEDGNGSTKDIPVSAANLLIGGAVIKDTEKCTALVCHCGKHSKLALNQPSLRTKFAHTDARMNQFVFGIFCFKIVIVIVATIAGSLFLVHTGRDSWYLDIEEISVGKNTVQTFFRYFGLLSYLIPISCAVSLEVAKFIQTMLMECDTDFNIYSVDEDGKLITEKMAAKTSILNDELALVEYVLSDKTGTLTENSMMFKMASVDGEVIEGKKLEENFKLYWNIDNEKNGMEVMDKRNEDINYVSDTKITMKEGVDKVKAQAIKDYLLALAICNEARPKKEGNKINYQSQSPDEVALCQQAVDSNVLFFKRTQTMIYVSFFGEILEFKVLAIFSFNSDRKRQSVIVQTHDGQIVMYTKGADSIIAARTIHEDKFEVTNKQLQDFSVVGLRTLLVTKKEISQEQYNEWRKKYDEADSSVAGHDENVALVQNEMEVDLKLIGATAIEDKLQDGVPETIEFLIRGGIKVWMITGDKVETAINIGLSCNLLTKETFICKLRNAPDEVESKEEFTTKKLVEMDEEIDKEIERCKSEGKTYNIGCVFEAGALQIVMDHAKELFRQVILKASVVICSRVTPKQKAMIAKTVKEATKKVVLTIGDGANDVAMINEGDIGVGLFGKEGTQAARASDYALRKFRHVAKLIMFHGRNSLLRNVTLIKMCFYKNASFFLILFWYSFFNGQSGMSMYDDYTMTFFNIFITSLPPVFIACLDKDLSYQVIKDNPEVHRGILRGSRMSLASFLDWLGQGIWQSLLLTFVFHFMLDDVDVYSSNGKAGGWAVVSMYLTFSGFFMVFFTLCTQVKTWNLWTLASFIISLVLFFIFMLLIVYCPGISIRDLSNDVFSIVFRQPYFYLVTLFTVIVGIVPNILRLFCLRFLVPGYYMVLQEIYSDKKFENYGKKRKIVIEGTEEAHTYYHELCLSQPLFNKLPKDQREMNEITSEVNANDFED
ncbi:phospholipid-transporting ATPase, putative [Entamoeba dispar SAW760]|uniref:Phospholipid-transporting ATPase n=1 Tax=Entamoeba dispar (strain ATCC PRA-260 / SAW760) TaxID=370354 RepID=B0ED52_ENTDS|nr:phospholipid-transporting ATPase, putative [Entamoeba dispar SAW760]EDR27469.1 phospholipid-transporting ATPase, putative [Entamoeba dispar SAW760]|eukprot:EDR27469.1 phospholipid-transporting ATPase, putative [Entamoeba dispar SAW760]